MQVKRLFVVFFCLIISCHFAQAKELFKQPYKQYNLTCGESGGKIILSASSDPKSFNPVVAQETSTTQITGFIFEGLTRTHPLTLEVMPCLAQNWETLDGKTWIFHLRSDVFWNDGTKFTADDVLFTYNDLVYNSDILTSSKDIFTLEGQKIQLEKLDDYTIKFILPFEFAPFLRSLSQEILPKHKYASLVTQKKFNFSLGLDSKPQDIVGTGPYRLKKYLPGEKIVLEKNPFYYRKDTCNKKLPYVDKIIFVVIPSPDTALLKFLEKEIDYCSVRPQDLSILGARQERDNFSIYNAGPAFGSNFIAFNQNSGANPQTKKPFIKSYKLKWFSDKNFRKAVSYAINRQKIIDVLMNGLGIPQYSPESPANTFFYSDAIEKYPYSPTTAKNLLIGMGFTDKDKDGILEDKEGNKLEINLFTNADSSERVQIATLIKKDLQDLGFAINFLPLDFNSLVNKLTASLDWEMILIGLTGGIEPYFGKNVWSYKGNLHMWNLTGKPIAAYEEEIETIFNQAARTIDEAKRKELFARFQEIVSQELPLVYTVVPYSLYAVRNRFGNLYPTVFGGAFSQIENVYLDSKNKF